MPQITSEQSKKRRIQILTYLFDLPNDEGALEVDIRSYVSERYSKELKITKDIEFLLNNHYICKDSIVGTHDRGLYRITDDGIRFILPYLPKAATSKSIYP
jgi:hypothetical protein